MQKIHCMPWNYKESTTLVNQDTLHKQLPTDRNGQINNHNPPNRQTKAALRDLQYGFLKCSRITQPFESIGVIGGFSWVTTTLFHPSFSITQTPNPKVTITLLQGQHTYIKPPAETWKHLFWGVYNVIMNCRTPSWHKPSWGVTNGKHYCGGKLWKAYGVAEMI